MTRVPKRAILIGSSSSGKTTLCHAIANLNLECQKTQMVQVIGGNLIDTPGEFLESDQYRGSLTTTAADADIIILVQAATDYMTMFWPAYSTMFPKPAIGVVTKCDMADEKQIETAKKYLIMAGAREVFETSSVTGIGIDALRAYLEDRPD